VTIFAVGGGNINFVLKINFRTLTEQLLFVQGVKTFWQLSGANFLLHVSLKPL
jgi:hypothetical protein